MAMQSTPGFIRGVFIDTETGGLSPETNGTTEVAMIHFEIDVLKADYKMLGRYQSFIKPHKWMTYSPGALALQSSPGRMITLDFLEAHGKSEAQVVTEVQQLLSSWIYPNAKYWNHQMWAQNAEFDHGFMSALHKRVLKDNPDAGDLFGPRCDWSCTRKNAAKLGAMIYENNCHHSVSMKDLMKFYGMEEDQTHSALRDCIDGVRVLTRQIEDEAKYYRQLYQVDKVSS